MVVKQIQSVRKGDCSKMTLLLVFVLCAAGVFAQSTTTAILTGAVTDPTQAVVPDAKITVTTEDVSATSIAVTYNIEQGPRSSR